MAEAQYWRDLAVRFLALRKEQPDLQIFDHRLDALMREAAASSDPSSKVDMRFAWLAEIDVRRPANVISVLQLNANDLCRISADHCNTKAALASGPSHSSPVGGIAHQLQELREQSGLPVEQIAAGIRRDVTTVFRHLSGKSVPEEATVRRYEKFFSKVLNKAIVIGQTPYQTP